MTKLSQPIEFLEGMGLVGDDQINRRLAEMSQSELNRCRSGLQGGLSLNEAPSAVSSPFSFLASSSFRGDRCCVLPTCRMKKSDIVAAFSALYAERLYLPIMLGHWEDADPIILEGSIKLLSKYRPLIDAGIIVPINDEVTLCAECRAKLSLDVGHLHDSSVQLEAKHVDEFRVMASIEKHGRAKLLTLAYEGPREYLEAGSVLVTFEKFPDWARKLFGSEPAKVPRSLILEKHLLCPVIEPSNKDFVVQARLGAPLNLSYLTDLECEAEFYQTVRGEDAELHRSKVIAELSHTIPLFDGLSLASLVSLRNDEFLAFRNYRNAISEAVRSSETALDGRPEIVARRIYDEQIRPEVEALEAKAARLRSHNRKSLAAATVGVGGLLSMGFLGHIPEWFQHAIEIVSSCSLATGAVLPRITAKDDLEVKNNAYYFLLKAGEAQHRMGDGKH